MARPTVVVDGSIWKATLWNWHDRVFFQLGVRDWQPLVLLSTSTSTSVSEETLTPAQLKRELRRIAWGQVRLAQKLGVWPSEVRDWLAGKEPVPEVVALDIRHLPSHNLRPPRPA